MENSNPLRAALLAAIDCVVPHDEHGPSASENDVPNYIGRILTTDLRHESAAFFNGLAELDLESAARHHKRFCELTPEQQTAICQDLEAGRPMIDWPDAARWFGLLVKLTQEGYYADPSNGGNPRQASWDMIGYAPRRPLADAPVPLPRV